MNETKLKEMLTKIKANSDIAIDPEAQKLIEAAIEIIDKKVDLQRVISKLKQDLDIYSVSHQFKFPKSLVELQLMVNKYPDKWEGAGAGGVWPVI